MSSSTLTKLEQQFIEAGYITGDMIFPTDSYHITIVGAKSGLSVEDLAEYFTEELHVAAVPLGSGTHATYDKLYFLLTYRPSYYAKEGLVVPGAWKDDLTVSQLVDYADSTEFGVAFIVVERGGIGATNEDYDESVTELVDIAESLGSAYEDAMDEHGLLVYPAKDVLPSDEWVGLRVYVKDRTPLSTSEIKLLLEGEGYKVVDPSGGLLAVFKDSGYFTREDYTIVYFNANGSQVSAAYLLSTVFSQFGKTYSVSSGKDVYKALGLFFTTQLMHDNQQVYDAAWATQEISDATFNFGGTTVETMRELMGTLNSAMGAVPSLIKLAIGGAVVYGAVILFMAAKKDIKNRR